MSTTLFVGRWYLLPKRVPMNMVFGRPIAVNRVSPPPRPIPSSKSSKKELDESRAKQQELFDGEVDRVHKLYKDEIQAIFDANKVRCHCADRELQIVD